MAFVLMIRGPADIVCLLKYFLKPLKLYKLCQECLNHFLAEQANITTPTLFSPSVIGHNTRWRKVL